MSESATSIYALFAFGDFYPDGGINDLRGTFATIKECRVAFNAFVKTTMEEQGYDSSCPPGGHDYIGQIVEISSLRCVETLIA